MALAFAPGTLENRSRCKLSRDRVKKKRMDGYSRLREPTFLFSCVSFCFSRFLPFFFLISRASLTGTSEETLRPNSTINRLYAVEIKKQGKRRKGRDKKKEKRKGRRIAHAVSSVVCEK